MKLEETECSETLAFELQTPGNHPEECIRHSEQGESLKSGTHFFITGFYAYNHAFSVYCCLVLGLLVCCKRKWHQNGKFNVYIQLHNTFQKLIMPGSHVMSEITYVRKNVIEWDKHVNINLLVWDPSWGPVTSPGAVPRLLTGPLCLGATAALKIFLLSVRARSDIVTSIPYQTVRKVS
jgi:hypothetical protein